MNRNKLFFSYLKCKSIKSSFEQAPGTHERERKMKENGFCGKERKLHFPGKKRRKFFDDHCV